VVFVPTKRRPHSSGAYETGSNPTLDEAIRLRESMEQYLRQDMLEGKDEASTREDIRNMMAVSV
jgi:flagellar biosynthesis/type III secretory pathway ATPase